MFRFFRQGRGQLVEVRCCCDPAKLLGYAPVPSPMIAEGQRITWMLEPRRAQLEPATGRVDMLPARTLTLEVGQWWKPIGEGVSTTALAIKSNDTPLETLRQIPGWRDADHA